MNEISMNLFPDSRIPMYEQIYEYIKNDIKNNKLKCRQKLPSTRALSQHLEVSRSTTQMAYDQLISEGYIEAVPCRGYFICQLDGLYDIQADHKKMAMRESEKRTKYRFDFSPSGIELNSFPFNSWRKVTKNVLIDDNKELFQIGEPQGEAEFRKTICEYLHHSRGVNCSPEQIVIGAGNEYLLMLINNLIGKDSIIAMENPSYDKAYNTFISLSRRVIPVDMDEGGLDISKLAESEASIAYVTPSHQYPLGIIMPVKRRNELLNWAGQKRGRYIIEDDYDSEFRYKGKPIPALQGNSLSYDKVIYLGTFSKSIAPAIRMSYMVLPPDLLELYYSSYRFLSCTVSRIDQTIVNNFIQEGYYERHLNKMRALYKNRHDLLLSELKGFENRFEISGEYAGIHILLKAKFETSENELVDRAKERNVKVYKLSSYYIKQSQDRTNDNYNSENDGGAGSVDETNYRHNPTVILGYANINNEDMLQGVRELRTAWDI